MKAVRIFVSSPGDVGRERESAARLIARLRAEWSQRVQVEGYFWEHEPMHAGADFQGQIPPPASFDVFIGILWSRLGSRLHGQHARPDGTRYRSGTEFEFENALEAYRRSADKTPRLLIYRRSEVPSFPAEPQDLREERERQWEALKSFIDRWFTDATDGGTFKAAFNSYAHTADFEERLEDHLRKLIVELTGEMGLPAGEPQLQAPEWKAGSPYRGLKVFDFEHAPIFFGRTQEIDRVIGQLRDRANERQPPFVLIFGSSGSGKSSLLRAGVIPLLCAGGVDGIGLWRRGVMQPSQSTGDLFDGLAAALLAPTALPELATGGKTAPDVATMLRENAAGVGMLIAGLLPQIAQQEHETEKRNLQRQAEESLREGRPADADYARELLTQLRYPEPRLILGLDQLEEIFTHDDRFPAENRNAFIGAIDSLVRSGFVWVVATLRSDFFPRCEEIPALVGLKEGKGQFHLLPPTATALGQIIRLPAQAAGVRFEDHPNLGRLDDVLRDEAMHDADTLPLLEFALDQLFDLGAADRILTHAEYEKLGGGPAGGLRGVFVTMADQVYDRLSRSGRASLPSVFVRLATLGASERGDGDGLLRFSRRTDIVSEHSIGPGEREVIEKFLEARLLVADSDASGTRRLAVAHEAILNEWPRARNLLEAETGHLRKRTRLASAAAEWEREEKNADRLATGVVLAEALEVRQREKGHLAPVEEEYVKLSERANRRRFVQALSVAAALVVVFAVLGVVAVLAARTATTRKRETQRILILSDLTRAEGLFESGEASSALAVLARATEAEPPEATVAASRLWFALTQRLWPVPLSQPMPHGGAITTACFNSNGTRVLTASDDGTARLWDSSSGQPIGSPMHHQRLVRLAAFSPDGRYILTACFDGTARLWDAKSTAPIPGWVVGHEDAINCAAFSPNSHWIATGSRDGTVRLWDSSTGQRIGELRQAENVHTLGFHPFDSSLLLTVSGKSARIFKVPENRQLAELAHTTQINAACFGPDGTLIATASDDGTARLWDVTTGEVRAELNHDAPVSRVIFSGDGKFIATSDGKFVHIWTRSGQPLLEQPIAASDTVATLAFSPDGLRVLTGSASGKVQMWNALTGEALAEPIRAGAPVVAAGFSGDGKTVLSATSDGVARVWKTPAFHPVSEKFSTGGSIGGLCISPTGDALAAGSADGTLAIWNVATAFAKTRSVSEGTPIVSTAFSPDGKWIATGGTDGHARLCLTSKDKVAAVSDDTQSTVDCLAFSPDGRFLATGSDAGVAQLWKLPDLRPFGSAMIQKGRITSISFSPDSSLLLTSSGDATARIWNTASGKEAGPALKAEKEVTDAVFSPDGRTIATSSSDGTAQLWSIAGAKKLYAALRHKAAIVSLAFSPDGQKLVTASDDGTAAVWDVQTGRSICDALRHRFGVARAIFSPDGKRVATASEDGTARLWDVATGQPLSESMPCGAPVRQIVFSHDGKILFTASNNRTIHKWDVDSKIEPNERNRLATFARALSSSRLQDSGRFAPHRVPAFGELQNLAKTAQSNNIRLFLRWFLDDPAQRTLSPHGSATVTSYINARIQEGKPASLAEAALLAQGAPETLKRIAAKEAQTSKP